MADDAQPKLEAAEAKAARKAAQQACSQVSEPSLANMASTPAAEEAGQAEVSSVAPSRRYSTRSAGCGEAAVAAQEVQQQQAPAQAAAEAATTPAAEPVTLRMSLRHLRTPPQQAHTEASGADTPVAQDGQPQMADSPGFAAAGTTPFAETAATPSGRYSLRASTVKGRQSVGTPLAPANTPKATPASGKVEGKPQLSPTEQGIRASLRRSARKSRGGAA